MAHQHTRSKYVIRRWNITTHWMTSRLPISLSARYTFKIRPSCCLWVFAVIDNGEIIFLIETNILWIGPELPVKPARRIYDDRRQSTSLSFLASLIWEIFWSSDCLILQISLIRSWINSSVSANFLSCPLCPDLSEPLFFQARPWLRLIVNFRLQADISSLIFAAKIHWLIFDPCGTGHFTDRLLARSSHLWSCAAVLGVPCKIIC